MDQALPRAPWLRRLPSGTWTAMSWCAAAAFALLLFGSTTYGIAPAGQRPVLLELWLRGALAVLLALVVGWVRRWPVAVFGVLGGESVLVLAFGAKTWPLFLAMNCLIGYLAAVRPRRTSLAAAGAELALGFGQWVAGGGHTGERLSDTASMGLGLAASIALPWAVGNSVRQQRQYGEALRGHAAAQAVVAERLRIARELHDMVAHSIGVIAIQAGAAGLVLDSRPEGVREALGVIESTSRETLTGLRRMLVSLRQAEAGTPAEGLDGVERLAERARAAGLAVRVEWRGRRPLPAEVDLAAFRIVQESVTNAVRHSGGHNCRVRLACRTGALDIEVVDDGRGGPDGGTADGFGIAGMRERVALLNGRFSAGPRTGGGFRVAAVIPV
ncbi:sensor histidine kinase [Streptomyces sp. NPDC052396]|uniref:sensor histidine kinase n=1 Tax=Streptomyces sp. NPDC052396 TaxID=3365689 RepID=UPI0037CEC186